jgi:predicted dienelactone hydrolase
VKSAPISDDRRSSRRHLVRPRLVSRTLTTVALAVVISGGAVALAGPAAADEIGQAPTASNINGNGSFSVSSSSISSSGTTFGGGTVYYPAATGRYPVIAISPGYTATWSSISWIGPRLASWGFVVVGINTANRFSLSPDSRGTQLIAALNWAVSSSPSAVQARADGSRRGVAGHSMGGGGALRALSQSSNILAGVPIAPWHTDKTWPEVTEPVTIVGGENDTVADEDQHAIVFYNSATGPKTYVEVNNGGHFFPQSTNSTLSRALVTHFKRWLNQDARFVPFSCAFTGTDVSDFRSTVC